MECPVGYDCQSMVGVSSDCPNYSKCQDLQFDLLPIILVYSDSREVRLLLPQDNLLELPKGQCILINRGYPNHQQAVIKVQTPSDPDLLAQ